MRAPGHDQAAASWDGALADEPPAGAHQLDVDALDAIPGRPDTGIAGVVDAQTVDVPVRDTAVEFGEDGLDQSLRDAARRDRRPLVRAGLLLADACALLVPIALQREVTLPILSFTAVALLLLASTGAYHPRITLSALVEAPHLISRLGFAALLVAPFTLGAGPDTLLALHALYTVPALVTGRAVSYALLREARRRGVVEERALILGGGRVGMDLLTTMFEHPEYGLRPVGFLDSGLQLDHREPLGPLTMFGETFDRYGVHKVIVAYGTTREAELVGLMRSAALRDVEIYIVPRFFDLGMAPGGSEVDDLWGVPLYRVRRAALRRGAWRVKRGIDVVVSAAALVLLAPLLAALALAVRVSGPGPILFRQMRIGQFGQEFAVLKFRTLRQPAAGTGDARDGDVPEPAAADPPEAVTARAPDPSEAVTAAAPDPSEAVTAAAPDTSVAMRARATDVAQRQTVLGRFLRRTSLDELPQLWNIFVGDMSLVGPRPEESRYATQFGEAVYGYRDRHRLTVGLTGWAQVHGLRGNTSIEERARFDNHYIEHWSLWRDVVILVRTVGAVLRDALNGTRTSRSTSSRRTDAAS